MSSEDWAGQLRLKYGAAKSIYDYLVVEEKLFSSRYDLYCFGLVYGILHNKKDSGSKESFIPITGAPTCIAFSIIFTILLA